MKKETKQLTIFIIAFLWGVVLILGLPTIEILPMWVVFFGIPVGAFVGWLFYKLQEL